MGDVQGFDARGRALEERQHAVVIAGRGQAAAQHAGFDVVGLQAQIDQLVGDAVQARVAQALVHQHFDAVVDDLGIADGGDQQGGRERLGGVLQGLSGRAALGGGALQTGLAEAALAGRVVPALARQLPARVAGIVLDPPRGPHLVEAVQQLLFIGVGQVLVGDGRRQGAQADLEVGALFRRVERFDRLLALEQGLDEGLGVRQLGLQRRRPLLAQHVVGVLTADGHGEQERAAGLEQRQGAVDGAVGGALAGLVAVEAQGGRRMQAPQPLHLLLGQGRAHGRHGWHARALAGDDVHIALDHHHRRLAAAALAGVQDLAGLEQAVQHPPLVEEPGLGTVQIFGAGVGIHGPAAERHHLPPAVSDREDDPVAEAVIGLAAVLGRDQHPGVHQVARLGALGDEVIFQARAVVGRKADAKAAPLRLGQAALFQIGAGGLADGAAQLGLEPGGGQLHPVAQGRALLLLARHVRVDGGQAHARLGGQPLDRLGEGQPFGLLQEADDVAVLAAGEAVIEALLVVDEERRALLLGERRQPRVLTTLPAQLHRLADDVGRAKAGLQFFEEAVVETHLAGRYFTGLNPTPYLASRLARTGRGQPSKFIWRVPHKLPTD